MRSEEEMESLKKLLLKKIEHLQKLMSDQVKKTLSETVMSKNNLVEIQNQIKFLSKEKEVLVGQVRIIDWIAKRKNEL